MDGIRIIEIPPIKMLSSGHGSFGEDGFTRFDQWFSSQPRDLSPRDYMWFDPERKKLVWYYALTGKETPPQEFDIVDFEGGLYAAAVSIDEKEGDGERVYAGIKQWIADSATFVLDERPGHYCLFHVITPPQAKDALGYNQLEIFVPIRLK